jgi:hypothetical protein
MGSVGGIGRRAWDEVRERGALGIFAGWGQDIGFWNEVGPAGLWFLAKGAVDLVGEVSDVAGRVGSLVLIAIRLSLLAVCCFS